MMPIHWFDDVLAALGWSLLHFLWQGTAIALVYALLLAAAGPMLAPARRYALACLTLALMAAAPALTFILVLNLKLLPVLREPGPELAWWRGILGPVVFVWLSGVGIFLTRFAAGVRFTRRLRASALPAPSEWGAVMQRLARQLGMTKPARLLESSFVQIPVVIGWLRPVILIPACAFAKLPAEQATALLAHELAHIRRHDYLVNLVQGLIESLLFYHPAVWWVSRQIRLEREMCCDDIAVALGGDAAVYARALAELEQGRPAEMLVAPASNGGSLLDRIRRLADPTHVVRLRPPGLGAILAMGVLLCAGLAVLALQTRSSVAGPAKLLRAAHDAVLYDPFLPSAASLLARYGRTHTVLPNGDNLHRRVPGSLNQKYASADAGRFSTTNMREDAIEAPPPRYPEALLESGGEGLVVIELAVVHPGRVKESLILASFHPAATASVEESVRAWRFRSNEDFKQIFPDWKDCGECLRIGRLGFEFRIGKGTGQVVDLAQEEITRKRLVDPSVRGVRLEGLAAGR